MFSDQGIRRAALIVGGSALLSLGVLASAQPGLAEPVTVPMAPGDPAAPTDTAAANPSYAPPNPVDCTDPNNAINCQSPPIDSPLVVGSAVPGSPFRD